MTNIVGIPSTRVSEMFVRQRLLQQVQYLQRELFRVETKLATGYEFQLPGESPVEAMRVMRLQRLLERKEQLQQNLVTNNTYLSTTDTALSQISGAVAEARAVALGVINTLATEQERQAAALQVDGILEQLLDAGNQKFRGRYLFAGSTTTVRPFTRSENNIVEYHGNETTIESYADVDLLFETNVTGAEAFGAISQEVRSSVDLDPILTPETRLADLRGGRGITLGSIVISDGDPDHTTTVDLSSAETIGDVARLLKANSPGGRDMHVEITPKGLVIQLDDEGGIDLSIREVGEGTTAHELGIFTEVGVGANPIYGSDLDPIVRPTTRLADVLGARARAAIWLPGADNDIIVEADYRGEQYNGYTIRFVDDPTVTVGNEVVVFDPVAKSIEVRIDEGHTTAKDVVTAINAAHDSGVLPFTARIDPLDEQLEGSGLVPETPAGEVAGTTAWGSGIEPDFTSGIQIQNGPEVYTIDFSSAETVEDLLNILNTSDAGVIATINEDATGINVRSRRSGADFAIGENGGLTATQLGLRTFTEDTRLEDLNLGFGVEDYTGEGNRAEAILRFDGDDNDLVIRARQPGAQWNGFVVELVAGSSPSISYDPAGKRITIQIVEGQTRARDIVQLFSTTPGLADDFQIEMAPLDNPRASGAAGEGWGYVYPKTAVTDGGFAPGAEFRIVRADGVMFEVDITGAETIGDILERINTHPDNLASGNPVVARLAEYGNGIELVDNSNGSGTLRVIRNGGSLAAWQLGLLPDKQTQETTASNPGVYASVVASFPGQNNDIAFRSVNTGTDSDGIQIVLQDTGLGPGSESVSWDPVARIVTVGIVPGSTTAGQVVDMIRNDPVVSSVITAQLQSPDEGNLNDGSGLVAPGVFTLAGGQPQVLTGRDVNPKETEGLFTALLRLKQGLETNDLALVQHAVDLIDQHTLQLNFIRAELGARQQSLDILKARLDEEHIELRKIMSEEHEADLAEVVSELSTRQVALQAALQAAANIFRLTLLDYL